MKILVTGHRGFIGGHMVRFLRKKGHTVKCARGDLRNYGTARSQTRGADMVFHFAASMGGIGFFSAHEYYPTINNFLLDLNVLKACEVNKVGRLFYPSSACAYPVYLMNKGKHLTEEMLNSYAAPDRMYGWEKLTMTRLMRLSPVDCRVGILHTVYGEGQEYRGERAKFPPQMAYKARESGKTGTLSVWGDGTATRTFLHIADALEKIYEVMMAQGYWGEVNIGSDQEVSVGEIVRLCLDILKIRPKVTHELDRPVGPKKRRCSNAKFNQHYHYRDKVSLREGFTRLINYINRYES